MMPLQLLAQFSLSGNVIDKENHEALIGAHISLKELNLMTVSDEFGNFNFKNIEKGTYTLEASYIGFKTYETTINITKDSKVKVAMTADFMMEDVRLKLSGISEVADAKVNLVFEPEWDKEMMSEEAKLELGFM